MTTNKTRKPNQAPNRQLPSTSTKRAGTIIVALPLLLFFVYSLTAYNASASPPRAAYLNVVLPTLTPTAATGAALTAPTESAGTSVTLDGMSHEWQTWNNCGPATLSMALSYHGYEMGQAAIAASMRPNPEDKNVGPEELVAFARSQGLAGMTRVNGDSAVLKRLLNAGFPVIVEVWLEPEPGDGFGHYRLLTGYDDEAQRWIAHDSYVAEDLVNPNGAYEGIFVPYELLEQQWRVFNRTFVVLYSPDQQRLVNSALYGLANDTFMWYLTLARAQNELEKNPDDTFAWFNRGSALVALERYEEAAAAYDRAVAIGLPWRMLWYQFGPLEAYHETNRHQDVVSIAERTLATTVDIEELHYWRGVGLAALGNTEGARAAWSTALSLRAGYPEAEQALASLESE